MTWEKKISIFSRMEAARTHLCQHVLPSAETFGWRALSPALGRLLPTGDVIERREFATRMWTDPDLLHRVYTPYAHAIHQAMTDATARNWLIPEGTDTIGFGLSGVQVRWNPWTVVTAFFPAFGYRDANSDESPTLVDPLPRDDRDATQQDLRQELQESCGALNGRQLVRYKLFRHGVDRVSDRIRHRYPYQTDLLHRLPVSWEQWLSTFRGEMT